MSWKETVRTPRRDRTVKGGQEQGRQDEWMARTEDKESEAGSRSAVREVVRGGWNGRPVKQRKLDPEFKLKRIWRYYLYPESCEGGYYQEKALAPGSCSAPDFLSLIHVSGGDVCLCVPEGGERHLHSSPVLEADGNGGTPTGPSTIGPHCALAFCQGKSFACESFLLLRAFLFLPSLYTGEKDFVSAEIVVWSKKEPGVLSCAKGASSTCTARHRGTSLPSKWWSGQGACTLTWHG